MLQMILKILLVFFSFIGYLYLLTVILKPNQIRRVFHWTYIYNIKYNDMLVTLIILETILTPINLPLLIMSGWKWRL